MTKLIKKIDTGKIRIATMVIGILILIIITRIPMIVTIEVITSVALWLRHIDKVSTSLVIIDNTSPCVFLSKYDTGNLFNFSDIFFLNW